MPSPLSPSSIPATLTDTDRTLQALLRSPQWNNDRCPEMLRLLGQGANPNAVYPAHSWHPPQTPLQLVAAWNHRPVVRHVSRLLLDAGADPNPPEHAGHPPVHDAIMAHDWLLVRLFVKHGARLDRLLNGRTSPLRWPINDDRPEMVRWMARHGAVLNDAEQPLLTQRPSALMGRKGLGMLNALVEAGAQVNPSTGEAPLVVVCEASAGVTVEAGQVIPVVRRLLSLGASPNLAQAHTVAWTRTHDTYGDVKVPWVNQGVTALHWAAWHGHVDLVDLLVEAGASPFARTSHRASPATMTAWRDAARDTPVLPQPDGGASPLEWARDAQQAPVIARLEALELRQALANDSPRPASTVDHPGGRRARL